jgi:hypothetical protein
MRDTRTLIAEQAQRIIQGGDVNSDVQVSKEELESYVDQCMGKYIYNSFYENKQQENESSVNGTFIYSFVEPVKCDKDRNRYYAPLSSTYVNLPNGMGIYSVSPIQDEFNTFVPLRTDFLSLTRGTMVAQLEGNKGYTIENTRLYLHNLDTSAIPEKLLIKLVGGIQNDKQEDDIDISLNMQSDIITMVVQMYFTMRQAPKDVINDNIK